MLLSSPQEMTKHDSKQRAERLTETQVCAQDFDPGNK